MTYAIYMSVGCHSLVIAFGSFPCNIRVLYGFDLLNMHFKAPGCLPVNTEVNKDKQPPACEWWSRLQRNSPLLSDIHGRSAATAAAARNKTGKHRYVQQLKLQLMHTKIRTISHDPSLQQDLAPDASDAIHTGCAAT